MSSGDGISLKILSSPTLVSDESEKKYKRKTVKECWVLEPRPTQSFVTGSKYKGTWNSLGMHGTGKYNFFYGVRNDGSIFDNMFHGNGILFYPNKSRMEGLWDKGHMIAHRYFYADDLCFGPYCQMPDRRFILERRNSLKPAGRSLKINSFKPREIPQGCYDTNDGFYDPKKKYVFDRKDPKRIVRIPIVAEHDWILKHCRKAWDEPVGFRPDLFENWYKPDDEDDIERVGLEEKILKAHFEEPDFTQSTSVAYSETL